MSAQPVAFRALGREYQSPADNEYRYGPWVDGLDRNRFEPLYAQDDAKNAQLLESLQLIAAQGSGVVGSTSRADAMALIAQLAINKATVPPRQRAGRYSQTK